MPSKQLGIPVEPYLRTVTYGSGDHADAERLRDSLLSNTGEPLSPRTVNLLASRLTGEKKAPLDELFTALGVGPAAKEARRALALVSNEGNGWCIDTYAPVD